MADIRENLTLVDRFSGTFQRWVDGIKKAVEGEQTLGAAAKRVEKAQQHSSFALANWNYELSEMANKLGEGAAEADIASGAFRKVFKSWQSGQAITDYMRVAMDGLARTLQRAGYSWTPLADGMDRISLAAKSSLSELVDAGYLVQRTTEQIEEQEEELPAWAQAWLTVKEKIAGGVSKLNSLIKRTGDEAEKTSKRGHSAFDKLGRKVLSLGAIFFTARKMVQYFRQAIERAPDNLAKPFEKLKENIRNIFDRSAVSALAALTNSFNRLNEALASPAGQQFVNVMGKIGYIIGTVVGGSINLLIQLIGLVIDAFGQMGVSASDVVTFIASIAAGLYVTLYNIVATMWNVIASFAEFLVNVWSHPAEAIRTLFWRLADAVLGFIQSIGDGFDALMSKLGISTGVGGWLAGIRSSAESKLNDSLAAQSQDSLVLERMDLLNYADTVADWTQKAEGFDPATLQLKAINANTRSSARSAASIDKALNDLDIAALIDVAERKFISQVNLTSQTPVITVNGANTGNTQQDRINLANTIRDILVEQIASSPMRSSNAYGV